MEIVNNPKQLHRFPFGVAHSKTGDLSFISDVRVACCHNAYFIVHVSHQGLPSTVMSGDLLRFMRFSGTSIRSARYLVSHLAALA